MDQAVTKLTCKVDVNYFTYDSQVITSFYLFIHNLNLEIKNVLSTMEFELALSGMIVLEMTVFVA